VPLEARAMWRQRFRWFKGGHLFLLSPNSVFFDKHKHMTFYHKTLYWICLVANMMSVYTESVLMALPFMCLALNQCVYGIDPLLFWTHFVTSITTQISTAYYRDWNRVLDSLKVRYRVSLALL
jgi:cellulose synthase/poly-beta-1,6-N-acetylglucosamine synthase-like glycosyltransferase